MKKIVATGLLTLLLCHMLAHMMVVCLVGWQENDDLLSHLRVYRSVDSVVEFYVPLHQQAISSHLANPPADGFVYRDNYYGIIRQEVKNDTLVILGYADRQDTFWQQDLLDFIKYQFGDESTSIPQKAYHLIKLLLKEYYPGTRSELCFALRSWHEPNLVRFLTAHLPTPGYPFSRLPLAAEPILNLSQAGSTPMTAGLLRLPLPDGQDSIVWTVSGRYTRRPSR